MTTEAHFFAQVARLARKSCRRQGAMFQNRFQILKRSPAKRRLSPGCRPVLAFRTDYQGPNYAKKGAFNFKKRLYFASLASK
jgi:hypothetical protein